MHLHNIEVVEYYYERARKFEEDALRLLASHEVSKPKIVSLAETRKRLQALNVDQQRLFDEAIRCAEFGLCRAAIVISWAGFIDYYEAKLEERMSQVHNIRPKWSNHHTKEDLADNIPESQLLDVGKDVGIFRKAELRAIAGLLAKRHECAHPHPRSPSVNEAVGYIADLLGRVEHLTTLGQGP